jgi:membrane protein involved in colicin uptake
MKAFKNLDIQIKALIISTVFFASLFGVMILTQGFNSF